jgi:hypothetical protein
VSSPTLRRCLPAIFAVLAASLCLPWPARAAFGPIELVSKSAREQAQAAGEPALSADGLYIVFCAVLGGHEGIFRERLENDQVEPVAVGPFEGGLCGPNSRPYATSPSISADGRYVSFTTKASLVPADTEAETSDVYVADMSTSPPTYVLASAEDGSDQPLPGGSLAAGRVALSADGSRVAFVNAGNVYVRNLVTRETILISAKRDPLTGTTDEPVVGGGAYEPAGAAISADGSTVAWVGEHLPEQVPLLGDEESAIQAIEATSASESGLNHQYHEPLWRRVPSPSEALPPTRRIVGGGDPLAPGCPPSGSIKEPQCQGPYPEGGFHRVGELVGDVGFGWGLKLPQLDADGDTVALAGDPDEQYDLFVVDMQEGLDRLQAVSQVTRWTNPLPQKPEQLQTILNGGSNGEYLPFDGEIAECAISPEGDRVAFTTTRQHFATAPYTLVSELPAAIGRLAELYELNLDGDAIERVTPGPGQTVSRAKTELEGAAAPSFGAGGRLIAFSSAAENLVDGDTNEAGNVFVVESEPPAPAGKSTVSAPPLQSVSVPAWRMTANAYSRPDGSVRLIARVPGSGTLHASARSQLGTQLKTHRVAAGRRRSAGPRTVIMNLKPARGLRNLTRKPGLVTRIHLTFSGHGGHPLQADLESRFLIHRKAKRDGGHQKGSGA